MAADDSRKKVPVKHGIPDQKELLRPLIFPNSQRGFRIFNAAVGIGTFTSRLIVHQEVPIDDTHVILSCA